MGAMERITVSLPVELTERMRQSVENGSYDSTDAIVDQALREWIDAQADGPEDIEHLRRLVDEGDASGPSIPAEQLYADLRTRILSHHEIE
jgi:antitoxin ParD1/3/4